MSLDQYRKTQTALASPRDTEYRAFSKITAQLIAAEAKGRDDLKMLVAAIHENRRLWGALASDCASERNLLPEDTRGTIINLSRWVNRYSSEVMRKGESTTPLIEVNRIMMDGLAGRQAPAA